MTDFLIYGVCALLALGVISYGIVILNRIQAEQREERMRKHLNWNTGHRTPRVAAAPRD